MNTKTYKQAFVVLAVSIFIVPQIAFAAWWNPLSWSIWNIFRPAPHAQVQATTTIPGIPTATTTKKVTTTTTPAVKAEMKEPTSITDNSATIKAQLEAKAAQDALIAKQKADEQAKLDAAKAEADRQAAEQEAIQGEKQNVTTLKVEKISCILTPTVSYLLPFTVEGTWDGALVQVRITDENGGVISKGFDVDKSKIDGGFPIGKTGIVYDSYGGHRNVELKAGLSGTYKINIYSGMPSYHTTGGAVLPIHRASDFVVEESGTFTLPGC